jgi:hypothetical protein
VFIVLKYKNAEMKLGQRMALERLCDACQTAGKETILIIARHSEPIENLIRIEHVPVSEYRYKGAWQPPKEPITVRKAMDEFLKFADIRFNL